MIPPVSGGIERPEGSKARGGSEAPEGSQHRGGANGPPPILLWTMKRTAPHKRALSPRVARRGKGRRVVDLKCPPQPAAPEDPTEPRHRQGRRWEARRRCREPRPPSQPPRRPLRRRGSI